MTIGQYERHFQDLSTFSIALLPMEQHQIERFQDGLQQELRKGLVIFQSRTMRELVKVTQTLESLNEEQFHTRRQERAEGMKRKEPIPYLSRPPFPRRSEGQTQA
jgi:hypothetical protein